MEEKNDKSQEIDHQQENTKENECKGEKEIEEEQEEDFDDVISKLGSFCRFQIVLQFLTFILFILVIYNVVLTYFTGHDPAWRCLHNNSSHFCSLHGNKSFSSDNDLFNKRCQLNRSEWSYVTSKDYSFVTEFDLVCDKTWIAALISGLYHIGGVISAATSGTLSDRIGRKPVFIFSASIITISSIFSSYIKEIWQLVTLNVIRGAGNVGCYYTTIVYLSEFAHPKTRSLTTNVLLIAASSSLLYLDLFAYFIRQWRSLSSYATFGSIPVIIALFFLPESPRWLLATGRKKEAELIMNAIAKFNGDQKLTNKIRLTTVCVPTQTKNYTYLDFARNLKIFKLTLTIVSLWFVVPVVYYTIALQSGFGGSMYTVFAISSCADIPGSFLSIYLSDRIGRKKSNLGGFFISGLLIGCLIFIPKDHSWSYAVNITIAFSARVAICITFFGIFVWTSELFPTVLRSQGLCLCAVLDRFGMALVPFVTRVLQNINRHMTFILMCVLAVAAAGVGLLLPETNNKPTQETYEDFVKASSNRHNDEERGVVNMTMERQEPV